MIVNKKKKNIHIILNKLIKDSVTFQLLLRAIISFLWKFSQNIIKRKITIKNMWTNKLISAQKYLREKKNVLKWPA